MDHSLGTCFFIIAFDDGHDFGVFRKYMLQKGHNLCLVHHKEVNVRLDRLDNLVDTVL